MVEPLRHRQTKEAATDMFSLQPPRHIPTLPWAGIILRDGAYSLRTLVGRARGIDRRADEPAGRVHAFVPDDGADRICYRRAGTRRRRLHDRFVRHVGGVDDDDAAVRPIRQVVECGRRVGPHEFAAAKALQRLQSRGKYDRLHALEIELSRVRGEPRRSRGARTSDNGHRPRRAHGDHHRRREGACEHVSTPHQILCS